MWKSLGKVLGGSYLLAFYVFCLGPLLAIIVMSFNGNTVFPGEFQFLTVEWYVEAFATPVYIRAFGISVIVAVLSGVLSVCVAIPLAFALHGPGRSNSSIRDALYTSPLLMPELGVSLAVLQLFVAYGIPLGVFSLVFVHCVFILPYTLRSVSSRLTGIDYSALEASMDLGAGRARTFVSVTFPLIRSSVMAGFILAAVMSFINVPISFFLSAPDQTTLPIEVMAAISSKLTPVLAAVAALTAYFVAIVYVMSERIFRVRLLV